MSRSAIRAPHDGQLYVFTLHSPSQTSFAHSFRHLFCRLRLFERGSSSRDKRVSNCKFFYCICCLCVHVMPCLRRRGGNGERRSRAHGVARSHVAYYTKFRRNEITARTKSNCRASRRGAAAIFTHAKRQAYTVKKIERCPTHLTYSSHSRSSSRTPSSLITYLTLQPYVCLPGIFSPLKSLSGPTVQTTPRA